MTAPPLTLAEELLLLAHDPARGRPLHHARYLRWGLAGAALAELEQAGRIAEEFPAGAVDLLGPARERFAAAAAAGFPDHRGRLLGALVSATGLDRTVLPGRDHRTARRAMKRLAQEIWAARAVERAVRADKSTADGS
ncbi:GPP34 family phosphoprotein [Streptomyces kronopolitis]|uniref:GPP34 family phosphoprotein n=1 Tax=Streptomyces kronopolitis TaxID=1612435 RepID=UPI00343BFA0E